MEPDAGGLLGAMIAVIAGLFGDDPSTRDFEIVDTPAEYRPLELSVAGQFLELGPASLSDVSLQIDPMPALLLSFRPQTAAVIASMTASAIGQPMTVSVCGIVVMRPTIQEAIANGAVQITTGETGITELEQLAQQISGRQRCDASPVPEQSGK